MAEFVSGAIRTEVNSENLSREFNLDEKEIKKRVKSTIALVGISTFILCVINFQTCISQYFGRLSFFLFIVSTIILFTLLTKIALSKVNLKISLVNGKLAFPYYYIWLSESPMEKILSSEYLNVNGGIETIIVGFESGDLAYFERCIFSSESQFYEFQECLLALVKRNSASGFGKNIVTVDRYASHTYIQLLIIFIWIATFSIISLKFAQDFEITLEQGALSRKPILEWEIYRFFSSFFLHSSYLHVAANILVFSALSQSILRLVDISRYLNILFISSLFASCVTLTMHSDEFVVGASGGVFGLFGAYCAVKMARKFPGSVNFLSDRSVYLLIGVEVLYGVLNVNVDIYSHVGGFIAGFLILRLFLETESSQSIYSSKFVGRVFSIILSVLFLGGLVLFFSRIYAWST